MTFGLWGPWDNQTVGDSSKMNGMEVISGPGFDLEALPKDEFRIVFCTEDGAELLRDHTYAVDTAAEEFIDISSTGSHTHTGTGEGGAVIDIFRANSLYLDLALTRTTDLKKASWIETAGGAGTAEDTTDGVTGERSIRLRTNTVSGDAYTIQYPHLQIDFSKRSFFQFKARIENITSCAIHSGVNCDTVTAVDSNTQKYSAEFCSATNTHWFLRSASGTDKTSSDTGVVATTNRVGIRIEHYPDLGTPEVDMYVDASTIFQKSSHVPITGASADNNLIKHSVKNATTADRPYHVYGSRICYYVSDNWI